MNPAAGPRLPRAVGRRITFGDVPPAVRDWVVREFGAVRVLAEHAGGMSPGCATTLATAGGDAIFVKAVGAELNPQTPTLFRQEIATLARLPMVPYRPELLASYDDRDWVGIALRHVPGRWPDLGAAEEFAAVARTVELQTSELTPAPAGVAVRSLAATAERWRNRWSEVSDQPGRFLPRWAADRVDDLLPLVSSLPSQLVATTLCHFDVRDDNLLLRPNGAAVIVDWGMARHGPAWTDLVLLALQKPTAREAQDWLDRWTPDDAQQTVTNLIVAFAGSQAWNSQQPPRPSLPSLAEFTREDARRLFAVARLRLGV